MTEDTSRYNDIINLPHHVSQTRPQMSATKRAAQFSPFAAVVGHEEAIEATAEKHLLAAVADAEKLSAGCRGRGRPLPGCGALPHGFTFITTAGG